MRDRGGEDAAAAEAGRVRRTVVQGDHRDLHCRVGDQHRPLQRPGARRLDIARRRLLLQDRRGARRRRHTRGLAGRDHHVLGSGHAPHGQEERHRALAALGRDARLHVGHLLGQDRHAHHQPDVRLQDVHARRARQARPGPQDRPVRDHRLHLRTHRRCVSLVDV